MSIEGEFEAEIGRTPASAPGHVGKRGGERVLHSFHTGIQVLYGSKEAVYNGGSGIEG
jgi:hypothetical protein